MAQSLQEIYAAKSPCFGCGHANQRGLQLKTYVDNDAGGDGSLIADWQAAPHHQMMSGILNGGIIGALLDCLCNWTAAHAMMIREGLDHIPPTVTAEMTVKFLMPTASDEPIHLRGSVIRLGTQSAQTKGDILVNSEVTASCEATFVVVKPGHPAYHRWD